jgi:hypothetical protein
MEITQVTVATHFNFNSPKQTSTCFEIAHRLLPHTGLIRVLELCCTSFTWTTDRNDNRLLVNMMSLLLYLASFSIPHHSSSHILNTLTSQLRSNMIPDNIKLSISTDNIIQERIRHFINMSSPLEKSTAEAETTSTDSQVVVDQTSQSTTDMSTLDHQACEASGLLQAEQPEKAKKTDIQDVCSEIDKRIIQLKADLRRIQLRLQDH